MGIAYFTWDQFYTDVSDLSSTLLYGFIDFLVHRSCFCINLDSRVDWHRRQRRRRRRWRCRQSTRLSMEVTWSTKNENKVWQKSCIAEAKNGSERF